MSPKKLDLTDILCFVQYLTGLMAAVEREEYTL